MMREWCGWGEDAIEMPVSTRKGNDVTQEPTNPCYSQHRHEIAMQPLRTPSRNTHFLTPDEVASRLRVTSEQVRSLIRNGILRAINVGAGGKRPLYRISPGALEDFINRDCNSPSSVRRRPTQRRVSTPDFFPDLK